MSNIPGANNVLPGVFTDIITQSRGISLPGGTRVTAIIGEGSTDDVIVSQAIGDGKDGLNPNYTNTTGADGRHFQLTYFPIVSNRLKLFKNGAELTGLESAIDDTEFSKKYDYRVDINTGRIQLQSSKLVNTGSDYEALSTNVGDGYLSDLSLLDANAPPETWTIRCVSVQRNGLNQPIAGTAKFLVFGSISGAKLDSKGNPIIWKADGYTVDNGILEFAIYETKVANVAVSPFREGDAFTVRISSGVLVKNDTLTANYIPTSFLNDPVLLQGLGPVVDRHGLPSLTNTLSLGAQLFFANNGPAVVTVQAAPPMPRRRSYVLSNAVNSNSENDDDFIFPLPLGVVPDSNSEIRFFITDNATGTETQVLPNKLDYFKLNDPGYPTTNNFIQSNVDAPAGYSFFYTVISDDQAIDSGFDGYIGRNLAFFDRGVFSSNTFTFDKNYLNKKLKLIETVNRANRGTYTVTGVSKGKLSVTLDALPDFNAENSVTFDVINVSTGLPVSGLSGTDGSLTPLLTTSRATLTSAAIDFSTDPDILTRRVKITGSTEDNNGLYDIISYNAGTDTLTIKMAVVNESNMRFEVTDPNEESNFVVINKNVVPDGYGLRINLIDYKEVGFYDAGWINALESLETVECDIVVPLPRQTMSVCFQNALSHCKAMSNIRNRKERVLFTGAIAGLTPDHLTGAKDAAVEDIGILEGIQGDSPFEVFNGNVEDLANYSVSNAFGSTYRCVYFYPDQIVVQAGADNALVDGFYIAAAAAGFASADPRVENPFTNKVFSGFSILRNKQYSTLTLESLAAAGVTTLQPVSGGGRVVWGITTSQSGFPEEQEISIVFIRDRVAKLLRAGFAGYIGLPETPDTAVILSSRAYSLLNSFTSQGLITNFADLNVVRDSADPRQWNISVRVQPTYPVNFIYIKVALGQI